MELNCDAYLSILGDIIDVCDNVETTKSDLETLINGLVSVDLQIETDILTMTLPTTMIHLNKYIIVQHNRLSKILLHSALCTLYKKRVEEQKEREKNQIGTSENRRDYEEETQNIKNYIDSIKTSCTCMSSRINIIQSTD